VGDHYLTGERLEQMAEMKLHYYDVPVSFDGRKPHYVEVIASSEQQAREVVEGALSDAREQSSIDASFEIKGDIVRKCSFHIPESVPRA
jgi:hypothetical protein